MPRSRSRNHEIAVRPEIVTPDDFTPAESLLAHAGDTNFKTIYADPPWRFQNRTGKMAPEHKRLSRYSTMTLDDIYELPVATIAAEQSHLYLWVPNALLAEGLETMRRWGFTYKANVVWFKIRKDNGPDGRGVGFYFRNVTELVLFGIRGKNNRTLKPGRTQVNLIGTRKRGHSRKPDEMWDLVERCSSGPRLEMFARYYRHGWSQWGDQVEPAPLHLVAPSTENEMVSRFADAAHAYMKHAKQTEVTSHALWAALQDVRPDLTTKTDTRKTPRTTMMRDLRKDERFVVAARRVALAKK